MGLLNIRNIPEPVHQALRERAARNGRSMEAEAREILAQACLPTPRVSSRDLQEFVLKQLGGKLPPNQVEEFLAERKGLWDRE